MSEKRLIVVSAVNLRKGGTLTILRQTLAHLSGRVTAGEPMRVVALVHKRELCDFPGIEYLEMPWCIKSWFHRLWAEYVTMRGISKSLGAPVDVWLSLHDTTPNVVARTQEVYCHTSFPFLRVIPRDWVMDPKIPVFAMMTKWYYRINARRNSKVIVQQQWFADGLSRLMGVPGERFCVIPPAAPEASPADVPAASPFTFLYASTPDCHKNFETLLEAARLLEEELGEGKFKVVITVKGDENRYARWLHKKWGSIKSVDFHGLMKKDELFAAYAASQCFVFPSRVETWGLPISEYMAANRKGSLLLADLPYAHETSAEDELARRQRPVVDFFAVRDSEALKNLMKKCYENSAAR